MGEGQGEGGRRNKRTLYTIPMTVTLKFAKIGDAKASRNGGRQRTGVVDWQTRIGDNPTCSCREG